MWSVDCAQIKYWQTLIFNLGITRPQCDSISLSNVGLVSFNGCMAQLLETYLTLHMTCHGVECSILIAVAIFDNTLSGVFLWNFKMSGYGIQWNPW